MHSYTFLILPLVLGAVNASPSLLKRDACSCGYQDSNGNTWRESIVSDFTSSSGALSVVNQAWSIQDWGAQHDSIYMQNDADNVYAYQDALGLKTSAYDGSGTTHVAEIDLQRNDILHGTFRMQAQIPSTPGVCFGFFAFQSNTEEIDIEFLTSDPLYYERVQYTNHGTGPTSTINKTVDGADFTTFGEHRFDWLPDATTFYYNGDQTGQITENVPTVGTTIIANVWSDGGTWSQGPPTKDAVATVQNIKLYFNSTSLSESDFESQCKDAGSPAVCKI